jgi:AAA ATPase domain
MNNMFNGTAQANTVEESTDHSDIINRDDEQTDFKQYLNKVINQSDSKRLGVRIINYYGPSGIGKTRLVKTLRAIAEAQGWETISVDFEPFNEARPDPTNSELIQCLVSILRELERTAIKMENAAKWVYKEAEKPSDSLRQATRLAGLIRSDLQNYFDGDNQNKKSRRLVAFFDGLNQVKSWFSILEQSLITPLMKKQFLLVIASRAAVRLERFELRQRLALPKKLTPLKPEDSFAKKLVEKYNVDSVSQDTLEFVEKTLHVLSSGHPNSLLFLLKHPDLNGTLVETAQNLKQEDVLKKLSKSLKDFLLQKSIRPEALIKNDKIVSQAIVEMSIYRRFDFTLLRAAIDFAVEKNKNFKELLATQNETPDSTFYTRLSQDMVRTYIVDWEGVRHGYVIEKSYRYILAKGLEAEIDAAEFEARLTNAYEQYKKLLEEQRGERDMQAFYFVELYYHARLISDQLLSATILQSLRADHIAEKDTALLGHWQIPNKNLILQVLRSEEDASLKGEIEEAIQN